VNQFLEILTGDKVATRIHGFIGGFKSLLRNVHQKVKTYH